MVESLLKICLIKNMKEFGKGSFESPLLFDGIVNVVAAQAGYVVCRLAPSSSGTVQEGEVIVSEPDITRMEITVDNAKTLVSVSEVSPPGERFPSFLP